MMPLYDNFGVGPVQINMGATIAQIWFWIFVEFLIPAAGVLIAYWRFSRYVDWRLSQPEPRREAPPSAPRAAA